MLRWMPDHAIDFRLLEKTCGRYENVLVLTDMFTKFWIAVPTRDRTLVCILWISWASTFRSLPSCISVMTSKRTEQPHITIMKMTDVYDGIEQCMICYVLYLQEKKGNDRNTYLNWRWHITVMSILRLVITPSLFWWDVFHSYSWTITIGAELNHDSTGTMDEWMLNHHSKLKTVCDIVKDNSAVAGKAQKCLHDRVVPRAPLNLETWS